MWSATREWFRLACKSFRWSRRMLHERKAVGGTCLYSTSSSRRPCLTYLVLSVCTVADSSMNTTSVAKRRLAQCAPRRPPPPPPQTQQTLRVHVAMQTRRTGMVAHKPTVAERPLQQQHPVESSDARTSRVHPEPHAPAVADSALHSRGHDPRARVPHRDLGAAAGRRRSRS